MLRNCSTKIRKVKSQYAGPECRKNGDLITSGQVNFSQSAKLDESCLATLILALKCGSLSECLKVFVESVNPVFAVLQSQN